MVLAEADCLPRIHDGYMRFGQTGRKSEVISRSQGDDVDLLRCEYGDQPASPDVPTTLVHVLNTYPRVAHDDDDDDDERRRR